MTRMATERDYVLGTHEEELARLGLQHRVWRSVVLDCWQRAGISTGSRVLDLGAGPGYATVDLAQIVGAAGEVVAVERSNKFVQAMRRTVQERSITNVKIHELDLMTDELPRAGYDFSWCRWVACFVADPALLIKKLAAVMPSGATSIFHEYGHYTTWRFVPPRENHDRFVRHVLESWRGSGGEPDIGISLPSLLGENGYTIRSVRPHIFSIRPADEMWQWPAAFIESGAARLQELGRIESSFVGQLREEFNQASADPNALMLTPLVLEIVAKKR